MRVRLAFAAITVATLATVGCQPSTSEPSRQGPVTVKPAPTYTVRPTFADHLAPCIEEDGSHQEACVWLADERGNGSGLSYYVVQGEEVYFLPSDYAHYDVVQRSL
jgi:hypothetical protein